MNVLVLNAGSSSLKYKLLPMDDEGRAAPKPIARGNAEASAGSMRQAAKIAFEECERQGGRIDAVGHRMVHGGSEFREPAIVTEDVLEKLKSLKELDPLHNPAELDLVDAARQALTDVPQVVVFDTAFHATLPELAWRYALPKQWADELGLRRYGFHGISYQYVAGRLAELSGGKAPARAVICHLGSGASVCALRDSISIDTSMGMTPLEGLIMSTRCGDVDPGLLVYLVREKKITLDALDDALNHNSGLAGLAEGTGGDFRKLVGADAGDQEESAFELFAYRIRKYIGAYAAALGGLDALVFTGGIGEGSAELRAEVCRGLAFLGISLDDSRNTARAADAPAATISAGSGSAAVWVIPTDEELEIARQTARLLTANKRSV